MRYRSANDYMRHIFGYKVYKISINGGFTCPNRDGSLGVGGCIFCSGEGSGDFSEDAELSVNEQIESGKKKVISKLPKDMDDSVPRFMAYFQAYTNTYAPVERLRSLFTEAIMHPDIVGISIATRPDCLEDDVIELLDELNGIKPVWVELGLQTIHKKTAEYIRRGYDLPVYTDAVKRLTGHVSHIITHVILGLPGESKEDMLETVRFVGSIASAGSEGRHSDIEVNEDDVKQDEDGKKNEAVRDLFGIKLQLLHVIHGTDLEKDYLRGIFECLTLDEYADIIRDAISILPPDMVVHRITGDGAKKTLVAPLWSADKKRVLNTLNKKLM